MRMRMRLRVLDRESGEVGVWRVNIDAGKDEELELDESSRPRKRRLA